jgi:hypothetical protein
MMDFMNFSYCSNNLLDIQKAIFVASVCITSTLKKLCFDTKVVHEL